MNLSLNSAMNMAINGARTPAADAPPLPGVLPHIAVGAPTVPFQDWIVADAAPVPALDADAPVDGTVPTGIEAEQPDPALAAEQAVVIDAALAAMSAPMAPAALPAMMMAMPAAKQGAANDNTAAPDPVVASDGAPAPVLAAPPAAPRAALELPVALPAGAATRPAAAAAAAPAAAAPDAPPADGADAPATFTTAGVSAGAAQPSGARGADSLTLAGPPTAWRQSLQEALGERLQLQLGRGAEQATIRLEPPMLGRIEISVRHSGGNLEVHIAASNSEVLRQLNTVSDSLRSDLAGRQYASVSVNVGETPRAQAGSQAGQQPSGQPGADAQGRGRQHEEQRQRHPGLALNDAGEPGSPFSMT